jgi:asparaginyl-tRNA synthetase
MAWQTISEVLKNGKAEQKVKIHGWVKSRRASKNVGFVIVNDGSQQSDLQLVVEETCPAFSQLESINTGSSVIGEGILKASPGKGQAWEVQVTSLELIGTADPLTYPLQKKGHTLEFLREISHLRCRTNTFGAVFRVRNTVANLVHGFFQQRGFIWAHTPIITANDCEGAGEMFQVTTMDLTKPFPKTPAGKLDFSQDFFGKQAHLTVSGQLQGEIMAMAFGKIYTFGPTFRAENSNTTRHLSEFWMIEPEVAFADLNSNIELAEDFLKHIFAGVVRQCSEELQFLEKHYGNASVELLSQLAEKKINRISYTDAVRELEGCGQKFEFPVKWGVDLQSEHEKYLTDQVFNGIVVVTDYPREIKAFYMKNNDDGKTVAAMDVLAPRIGEIIGGSQREDRHDVLAEKIKANDLPVEDLQWYLDLRRYGSTPHAGFGLGFERLVQYVTGMQNIRDVIPFPRAPKTIQF